MVIKKAASSDIQSLVNIQIAAFENDVIPIAHYNHFSVREAPRLL